MANRGSPTQMKRLRERARQDRQKLKGARRVEAKARRDSAPPPPSDEDRDLAGINPGPQPLADWQKDP
jgi:hypothetical protein